MKIKVNIKIIEIKITDYSQFVAVDANSRNLNHRKNLYFFVEHSVLLLSRKLAVAQLQQYAPFVGRIGSNPVTAVNTVSGGGRVHRARCYPHKNTCRSPSIWMLPETSGSDIL